MKYLVLILSFLMPFAAAAKYQLVGYWGQSDLVSDPPLNDPAFDVYDQINIAFADHFLPNPSCAVNGNNVEYAGMNFAGYCWDSFGCGDFLKCDKFNTWIKYRQGKNQRIAMSFGGASGSYDSPKTQADADSFAMMVWNLYLGGSSNYRPFGDAILDGVDFDLENNVKSGWEMAIISLRNIFNNKQYNPSGRHYYITGAPQCPYPEPCWGSMDDPYSVLGNATASKAVDFLHVQFYPNQGGCQITGANFLSNFQQWATWANTYGKQILVGVPAAPNAAGAGYLSTMDLAPKLKQLKSNSAFGGLMLWNIEFAKSNPNENYGQNAYNLLKNL